MPDAVITELRLGQNSGYELLIWMRESKNLPPITVYVLAGIISSKDRGTLAGMEI
jgi:hypothetical protein